VCCQAREYVSQQYDDFRRGKCSFEDVTDYLTLIDANSLYPAAQKHFKYAYGKWTYLAPQPPDVDLLNNVYNEDEINRSMYLVDVSCPRDLITAFLLSRDSDGNLVQDLEDKKNEWYWGCEIIEAIILGYKVTAIHEIKRFELSDYIFNEFVTKCWEGRKAHPPPNIQNLTYKQAMNELTGKFGQKVPKTNHFIYTPDYSPRTDKNVGNQENFENMMKKVVDFTVIWDRKTGTNKATIFETENECLDPSYPIYLSGQILAYSKVWMSRAMRACNAYLDPSCAMYYTDTDSLCLPAKCIPILQRGGYIGKDLGQFSCDLGDFKDQVFAKILVGIFAATKGPYSMCFICPKGSGVYTDFNEKRKKAGLSQVPDGGMLEKVRVKGMPHINGPFPWGENIEVELDEMTARNYKRAKAWLDDPFGREIPSDLIGERIYMYRNLYGEEERIFAKHINYEIIRHVMERQGELVCFFGTMKKSLVDNQGKAFQVRPNVVRRMLLKSDWWARGKRIFMDGDEDNYQALSYPVGFDPDGSRLEVDYSRWESGSQISELF